MCNDLRIKISIMPAWPPAARCGNAKSEMTTGKSTERKTRGILDPSRKRRVEVYLVQKVESFGKFEEKCGKSISNPMQMQPTKSSNLQITTYHDKVKQSSIGSPSSVLLH